MHGWLSKRGGCWWMHAASDRLLWIFCKCLCSAVHVIRLVIIRWWYYLEILDASTIQEEKRKRNILSYFSTLIYTPTCTRICVSSKFDCVVAPLDSYLKKIKTFLCKPMSRKHELKWNRRILCYLAQQNDCSIQPLNKAAPALFSIDIYCVWFGYKLIKNQKIFWMTFVVQQLTRWMLD